MVKTVKIPNSNNKLACPKFSHISFAPPAEILKESQLPLPVLIQSGSESIAANLIAMAIIKLRELSSIDTYLSAGVDRTTFMTQFLTDNPGTDADTRVAVYIYHKLTPNVNNQQPTTNN